ncbi:hypothetical protein ACF0H5_009416 [Mactra antiquata]
MYPGQSDILLKQFAKATKYPYRYLFIDLKPFTPEDKRLKCMRQSNQNLDYIGHMTPQETIKEGVLPDLHHSLTGLQSVHIEEKENLQDYLENNSEEIMDNGQACDDCGQLFDTVHDVQRHVKNGWCPELMGQKKRKHDKLSDSEQEEDTVEDNEANVQLWKRARASNDQKFEKIYSTFMSKKVTLRKRWLRSAYNPIMRRTLLANIKQISETIDYT